MERQKQYKYLFRGTTLGWQGTDANLHLPRTCVTTHPVKAVLFALCCKANNRVIYVNTTVRVAALKQSKNVLAPIEDEVAFEISPRDYAAACEGYVLVEDAIAVLRSIDVDIPQLLDRTLLDMALKDVTEMDFKTTEQFYLAIQQYLI